jgi:competence protein ComEC
LPCICLAGGILIAHLYISSHLLIPWTMALVAVSLALALVFRNKSKVTLSLACACFFFLGASTQLVHRQTKTPKLNVEDGEVALLSGCVVNPPVFSPSREQFTLQLAPKAAARVTVNLKDENSLPLRYGQSVELTAKVRTPRNFQNPDAFDYAAYLAAQRIYWNASVSDVKDVHVTAGSCGSQAVSLLYDIRTWALERIRSLFPDDPHTVALLQATLLGETSGVEKRWTSDFRVTGTYHALVISGQHVSVLALSLLFLLRMLRLRRLPALGVATLASWLYAFVSGFSSPVVRAAAGFTLFLVASYCFRRLRILNVLSVVGIVYLFFAPDQLFDPSFQLSFLSAAAIAAFAIPLIERTTDPMRQAIKRFDQLRYDPQVAPSAASWRVELRQFAKTIQTLPGVSERVALAAVVHATSLCAFVVEAVLVSACVQFALALPMISYFHRLSITGLSANIVIIPLLSLVVPLGFACILTGWHALAVLTKQLLILAELVATWHANFEPAWRMGAIPVWLSIAFAASLILLAYAIRRRQAFITPTFACASALFLAIFLQPWRPLVRTGWLELSAIDVSQGDSVLLVFPNGKTMLVDAGGFPGMERMRRKPQLDIGEDVVAPYLWSRRIRHLDYAVLTHGHSDHMAGLPAILDDFRPKELWVGAEPESPAWSDVKKHAASDGVSIRALNRSAKSIDIGGASIRVLAPSGDYQPDTAPGNNDSLVLEVKFKKRSILLTGDAERASEADMVSSGMLQPVTLLKVGHHGSRTSSTEDFLNLLQPKFAVISDGYKNQFRHPHPDVLARLKEHDAGIFRTDQNGLITFRTDGDRVEISSFH